jgi:SAM-dependent methyltransferase
MADCAELAEYEWLVGSEAAEILSELAIRREAPLVAATRLRRGLSASRVHLVLEQAELRKRASAKFAYADRMYFTPKGLEQATDQWIAGYKARRFAGRGRITDLCCGIGGDLLALAEQEATVGVDRDPIMACFAAANVRAVLSAAVAARLAVESTDVGQFAISDCAAWHIDPDRRPKGNRTSSLEWSSPKLEVSERLLAAVPDAAIKLAPAAEVPALWADGCELEWISRNRECRQLVAWHGALAQSPGHRRATMLDTDGVLCGSIVGRPNVCVPIAERINGYLFEPDPAVLAAHLTGELATRYELARVSAGIAYLTGDRAIVDPMLSCFAVTDVLSLDVRQLAAFLHDRGVGRLEIKKRGVDIEPDKLRGQLKLRGDRSATLILTPHGGQHVAILGRRMDHPGCTNTRTSDLQPLASSHATCF